MRSEWLQNFMTLAGSLILAASTAQAKIGQVDINHYDLPDSSLADFSFLVPAPAGTKGFVTTRPDGHFYFEKGGRARFWGINVSSRDINQPNDVIDATVERFRRAGLNMLRLEAPDNVGMLLDTPVKNSSRNLNAAYLNRMHYWMAACKRNGLYTYFQLLDFRTFREGDGVLNAAALGRAAKPYAFFDPKLISLQKEYARQLLLTTNPYTQTKPIHDPSIAVLEIANEHGLFLSASKWRSLAPPYDRQFQVLWNTWLHQKYGSTTALARAWSASSGTPCLQDGESLENGTVQLPDMSEMTRASRRSTDKSSIFRSTGRVDDGARFGYHVQRTYFREMKSYLRGLGVKVPMTCVVSTWIAPDVQSVAEELDFTAENAYWDHPVFEPDREWQAPFYYQNRDPLQFTHSWTFPPFTAGLRWKGKPVFIREWSAVWPNEYRSSYAAVAAAYASFQDLDGMLAFTYTIRPDSKLGDFRWERDPLRWGLIGLGALMFHRQDIAPAASQVDIAWNEKDLFTWQDYLHDLYRVAYVARLQNVTEGQPSATGALRLRGAPEQPSAAMREALNELRKHGLATDDDLKKVGVIQGGEVMGLDSRLGFFSVIAPRSVILAGRLSDLPRGLFPNFSTKTPYGVLWASSLDGKRLTESDHYVVKMVSAAKNTGEEFTKSDGRYHPDRFALKNTGSGPIVTRGQMTQDGTRTTLVTSDNQLPLTVGLINGTWEMERQGGIARITCDTPGTRFQVPGAISGAAILKTGQTQPMPVSEGVFTYPDDTVRVELRF